MIIQIMILFLWLFAVPTVVGCIFTVSMAKKNIPFLWVTGQILLWAIFQFASVPFILMKRDFSDLVLLYQIITYLLVILSVSHIVWRQWKQKHVFLTTEKQSTKHPPLYYALWVVFWVLLVFQVFMVFYVTYGDGDDAFYVAVATITEQSDMMYQSLPYTGGTTGLDARYGLAPFPVWLAFLARLSGMRTVSVAHVAVPAALIPMTYAIYYLIGRELCKESKKANLPKTALPIFMVFIELLVLFGDYSFHSPENFLIARSRQGKSALANIILPFMVFLFLLLLQRIQENQKIELALWILLIAVITAACLCSTFGALLACLLVGTIGLCGAVCYRKWKFLIPMGLCCIPALVAAWLYIVI